MGSQQHQQEEQEFCLKWNNHQSNMLSVFDHLLASESFVDVTIACDGLVLKAHKVVLSACSPYFRRLLEENPCPHPIIILADVRHDEMRAIIEFMYKGEVNVTQDQLSTLLKTAETLKVKGLTEVTNTQHGLGHDDVDHDHVACELPSPPLPLQVPLRQSYRLGTTTGKRMASSAAAQPPPSARRKRKPPPPSATPAKKVVTADGNSSSPRPSTSTAASDAKQDSQKNGTSPTAASVALVGIKQESTANDELDAINEFTLDTVATTSAAHLLTTEPSSDNDRNNSNQALSSVSSEKAAKLGRFDDEDDGGDGGGNSVVTATQDNVAANSGGGPSTSTEKKPKEKKKTTWTVTDLMRAIESVRSGQMNVLKAAMTFKIPKSSLYDYVKGRSGARLRLMKRFQPLDAMRLLGTSGSAATSAATSAASASATSSHEQYVARALPFLNRESATAALLASGDMTWPRMLQADDVRGEYQRRQLRLQTFSEYFSPDELRDLADADVDDGQHLLAVRDMCNADMAVANDEIVDTDGDAALPLNLSPPTTFLP